MDEKMVSAAEIVAQADLEPFEAEELDGATVVDALLIFRYQHPDWTAPRTAYIGSESMTDELRIGLTTMVNDKIRDFARQRWSDE